MQICNFKLVEKSFTINELYVQSRYIVRVSAKKSNQQTITSLQKATKYRNYNSFVGMFTLNALFED